MSEEKWGDPIDETRKQELWARLRAWWNEVAHGGRIGPFENERLTGTDVFWLAVYAIVTVKGITEAQAERFLRLGYIEELSSQIFTEKRLKDEKATWSALKFVNLQGANLSQADLEKAFLVLVQLNEANLGETHLERAYLYGAQLNEAHLDIAYLERAKLSWAQLDGADLTNAHMEGAILFEAHLDRAILFGAHLERTTLNYAHLQETNLVGAFLDESDLTGSRLDGASLDGTSLDHANLQRASLDKYTQLNNVGLAEARLDGTIFDNTNLSNVKLDAAKKLLDERIAHRAKYGDEEEGTTKRGSRKNGSTRRAEYQAAARAYRGLAVALQTQGMNEEADRYIYRAQIMQRKSYYFDGWRSLGRWLFSGFLAVTSGYGYHMKNILLVYAGTLLLFAGVYFKLGIPNDGAHTLLQKSLDALLLSFTAIHGRTFQEQVGFGLLSWVTAVESVVGLVIEAIFAAMLIQRFFNK